MPWDDGAADGRAGVPRRQDPVPAAGTDRGTGQDATGPSAGVLPDTARSRGPVLIAAKPVAVSSRTRGIIGTRRPVEVSRWTKRVPPSGRDRGAVRAGRRRGRHPRVVPAGGCGCDRPRGARMSTACSMVLMASGLSVEEGRGRWRGGGRCRHRRRRPRVRLPAETLRAPCAVPDAGRPAARGGRVTGPGPTVGPMPRDPGRWATEPREDAQSVSRRYSSTVPTTSATAV